MAVWGHIHLFGLFGIPGLVLHLGLKNGFRFVEERIKFRRRAALFQRNRAAWPAMARWNWGPARMQRSPRPLFKSFQAATLAAEAPR